MEFQVPANEITLSSGCTSNMGPKDANSFLHRHSPFQKKKNEAIVFPNSGDMSHDDWTIANLTNQPKIKSLFQQCLKRRDTVQISSPLGAEMKVPCGLQNCFGGGYHP